MVAVVVSGAVVVAHMAPEPLGVMGAGWGVDGDLGGSTPVEYLNKQCELSCTKFALGLLMTAFELTTSSQVRR